MNRLVHYFEQFRAGEIEMLRVVDQDQWDKLEGSNSAYLGEVLGKHSEVTVVFDREELTVVADDSTADGAQLVNAFGRMCGNLGFDCIGHDLVYRALRCSDCYELPCECEGDDRI